MNTQLPIRFCLLVLLMLPFFGTVSHAQVDQTTRDSLRAVEQIREEQQQLRQELRQLQQERDGLRADEETSEQQDRLEEIDQRIDNINVRLEALERSLETVPSSGDEGEEWSGEEDEDVWDDGWEDEWEDDEWSWWKKEKDDGGEYDIENTFFEKYPGDFPWMFPLTSRLNESFLRYNRVEGLYIGISQPKRLYWHSKPWLVSSGSVGYGFANHTWRYGLGLYVPFYLEDMIVEIGGEGHSFTDSKDQWRFDRDENTFTAIVAREDFLDYFEREGFSVNAAWYYRGDDAVNLRASAGYVHDTYGNMNRATNWSIFGGDKEFRVNPLINDGNVNSVVFAAGLSTLLDMDTKINGWDSKLQYEKAGGFAAGDFEFSQILVDIRRYQDLGEHFNVNLRIRGGASDGLLPQQRALELGGPGTLPGYRYKEFSGSHMLLGNFELIVRNTIAGRARGWASRLLRNANLILFADAGSTNRIAPIVTREVTNGALETSFTDSFVLDNWKSDVGVALGSIEGNFRIGAAWRLDRSESPNFVLRFSRPF